MKQAFRSILLPYKTAFLMIQRYQFILINNVISVSIFKINHSEVFIRHIFANGAALFVPAPGRDQLTLFAPLSKSFWLMPRGEMSHLLFSSCFFHHKMKGYSLPDPEECFCLLSSASPGYRSKPEQAKGPKTKQNVGRICFSCCWTNTGIPTGFAE